jgi:signal transduction histidine kinase
LQTGRIVVNRTKINLLNTVKKACEFLESSFKQKKINIVINIETGIQLKADVFMISSVLHNLLSNAIKFTHPEGTITISAEYFNKELVKVCISDTGVGIAEEDLAKLFRTDESFSTQGTNEEKGTGLGLILCKKFIQKNGGDIWVESEVNKGSQFFFTLPLHKN